MKKNQIDMLFHIPDIEFSKYCEEKYQVNKGIYNTIDQWFYKNGLRRIIDRRKTIIDFLHQVYLLGGEKKVKFGPGGLTVKLEAFSCEQKRYYQAQ